MSVNEKMTAIADKIRHYTYETEKLTLDDMANKIDLVMLSGYNNGFVEGEQSGYTTGFDEGKTTAQEEITGELNEILLLQDSYINPKISFIFIGIEYSLSEKEAYWTDKLSFPADWSEELFNISNNNGYASWAIYNIEDSEGNLIKYNASIKNNEIYTSSFKIEFTIKTDNGNTYLITTDGDGLSVQAHDLPNSDSRFLYDGDLYFTPEETGLTYKLLGTDSGIYIGSVVEATLVEGENE